MQRKVYQHGIFPDSGSGLIPTDWAANPFCSDFVRENLWETMICCSDFHGKTPFCTAYSAFRLNFSSIPLPFSGSEPLYPALVPIVLFISVKSIDPVHFILGQGKMIKLRIFFNVVWIAGAWNHHHTLLQIPAQNHLR